MNDYRKTAEREQRILKYSIVVTIILAVSAIVFGVFVGSSSIIFDGMFSAVDCVFSIAALLISRLILIDVTRQKDKAPRFTERFQHGFWHFEPILLAINGISLFIAVVYGFFQSINTIWHGGHIANFGPAVGFAFFAVLLCFGMAIYENQKNKKIDSAFIALDAKSWIVSGGISLALLVAFIFAFFIRGTALDWLLPYVDPAALAVIALVMVPMPIKTIMKAMQGILIITPMELDERVNEVVEAVVEKYGFVDFQNYLAQVGRSTFIEIHLILPNNYQIGQVETLDKIRQEIGDAIGEASPDRWLTISFTGKEKWAY